MLLDHFYLHRTGRHAFIACPKILYTIFIPQGSSRGPRRAPAIYFLRVGFCWHFKLRSCQTRHLRALILAVRYVLTSECEFLS